jgi:Fe-Mn family superoxide dismutase
MATATAKAVQAPHFDLPPLPYAEDALEPVISRETLALHHGKHHRKYVDTMNELLQKEPIQARSLEDVVRQSKGKLFNNAGQAWNHDFYWKSLSPQRQRPSGALGSRIDADFGSYERFAEQLAAAAAAQFGSGWAWLVEQDGKLQIQTTANADSARHPLPADHRRLGARLLRRLSQPARALPVRGDRRAPQLEVRRAEPRLAA